VCGSLRPGRVSPVVRLLSLSERAVRRARCGSAASSLWQVARRADHIRPISLKQTGMSETRYHGRWSTSMLGLSGGKDRQRVERLHRYLRSESDHDPRMRALSGRQDLPAHALPHTSRDATQTPMWAKPCLWRARPAAPVFAPVRSENDRDCCMAISLFWPPGLTTPGPTTYASALPVSRTIPTARMGEALFGGPTHDARTNAVSREEHLA
jgi:hypothetical protein